MLKSRIIYTGRYIAGGIPGRRAYQLCIARGNKYIIDPNIPTVSNKRIVEMPYKATIGVPMLVDELLLNSAG
jgi:hypothetical protein